MSGAAQHSSEAQTRLLRNPRGCGAPCSLLPLNGPGDDGEAGPTRADGVLLLLEKLLLLLLLHSMCRQCDGGSGDGLLLLRRRSWQWRLHLPWLGLPATGWLSTWLLHAVRMNQY